MRTRATLVLPIAVLLIVVATSCKLTPARSAQAVEATPLVATLAGEVAPRGRILFIRDGQLWMWSDGTVRLVASKARFGDPSFSPDGKQIAVVSVGTNHSDLFLLNDRGQLTPQLTSHWSNVSIQDSAWARHPVWSPDGRKIVYVSDQFRSDMGLWAVDVPPSSPRRILGMNPGSGGVDWPTWSPDGTRIAYTTHSSGSAQVHVLTLASGQTRSLTQAPDGAYDPAWSPDGNRLAYIVRESGHQVLTVANADGSGATRLLDAGIARAPAWSPDGSYIAYIGSDGAVFDVYAVRVRFDDAPQVSNPKQLTSGLRVEAPSGLSWAR